MSTPEDFRMGLLQDRHDAPPCEVCDERTPRGELVDGVCPACQCGSKGTDRPALRQDFPGFVTAVAPTCTLAFGHRGQHRDAASEEVWS